MFVVRKTVEVMTLIVLQNIITHADVFQSHIDHVNHETLKIYRSGGVSSTFLAVMRCFY